MSRSRRRETASRFGGAAHHDMLEQENNDHLNSLSSKVAALKGLTMDIEAEVQSQNEYLDEMGSSFGGAGALLQQTLGRLGVMLQTGGAKTMWYLAAFIVFVFFVLWWFARRS
ncbi:hypothetical protein M885DRAFT_513462 [Pelagophyceae sp. CCMP2097]|nr:hypothetical protein M885DRAFT_513462 [Pelagophyceae sp. CCMP2097]